MRNSRWLCTLAVACLVLASPWVATAEIETPMDPELDGSNRVSKALDYVYCAVSIAFIESGVGVALAVLTCGKALNVWWTE